MEPTQHRVLHQYGDRELWYAESEDKSWSLPLFVEFRHDKAGDVHYCHIVPAFCPYYNQALALKALLQPHDIQGRDDQWIITRRMAEALLHKAPGITPRFYYCWPSDDCPPIERHPLDVNAELKKPHADRPTWNSFAQFLSKERKISVSIINAVLRGIADEGPKWMVEHRRPLDLGFCRLIAAPFRANWKEIVTFKTKYLKLRSLLRLPEEQVWKALEDVGLPSILTSPHNIGLRRGWKNETDVVRIDYTIEAIPSEQFESAVNRIEGKRMSRGGAAYITEFEDSVEALYKSLAMALRSYMAKVARPFAQVGESSNGRVLGFLPVNTRKVAVRNTPLNRLPIRCMDTDSGFSVYGTADDAHLVRAKAAPMPKMPALLQDPTNVRRCEEQGDVDGPQNWEQGDDGVRLLATVEGGDSEQQLLVGGEATRNGVADVIFASYE